MRSYASYVRRQETINYMNRVKLQVKEAIKDKAKDEGRGGEP